MRIIEAINRVDAQNPNNYSQEEKIAWLSMLDGIIKAEVIGTHEGGDDVEFTEYNSMTPLDTEMLVPFPYDELYIHFLESKIHWANEEYAKYNNAVAMYNNAFTKYKAYYTRNNMPLGGGKRFIF